VSFCLRHTGSVTAAAFCPGPEEEGVAPEVLISSGLDGNVCVWDPRSGSCLAELRLAERLKAAPVGGVGASCSRSLEHHVVA
jgi:WD40 repeat protein